jgi:hypothetical protein
MPWSSPCIIVHSPGLKTKTIEAAAEAGVKCILPIKFGGDSGNERLEKAMPVYAAKRAPREKIELPGKV